MELATEPDTYSPNIDDKGNYVDKVPSFHTNALANGLRCPCGTRKDKIYASHAMFTAHIKTKTHEKWLQDLNTNRANFYIENQKLKDIVHSQKIMIGKLEIELTNKNMTIDYLTQQLVKITSSTSTSTSTSTSSKTIHSGSANDMIMFDI
jgi:hypothetical protein